MITIEIENQNVAKIKHDDKYIGYIQKMTLDSGTGELALSATVLKSSIDTDADDGMKTAQALKDAGFTVFIKDFSQIDSDGNPSEYLF